MTTLLHWIDRAALADGESCGLRLLDRRERPSWRGWPELVAAARAVAADLGALGVEPGERVALIYPTSWEFVQAFLGTLLAGAVPTPLYPPVRLGRLDEYSARTARLLQAAGARLVLTDGRVRRVLGHALEAARPAYGAATLDELRRRAPEGAGRPVARPAPESLALVQFSSGTTVDPKPVALSHRAIVAQVEALSAHWPDDDQVTQSGVSWLPLYHDMGLIGGLLSALQRPATLTLIPPELFVARPGCWLRAISRYRATISPAPNFAYALAADRVTDAEIAELDLSSWRVALDGAESVAPSVLRRFCQRFEASGLAPTALTPVYGLSEASLAVTFSDLEAPFLARRFDRARLAQGRAELAEDGLELVSVGRPLPGFAVEIRDRDGQPRAEGEVGTLWVRGPSLMEGYLGRPEATRAVLRDGWLDTGDSGFLFAGELYLCGRIKDLLILRGRNHAPEEVEHPVGALPGVRTGCVVARSEPIEGEAGERLWLFVERARPDRRAPPAPADDELERACAEAALRAVGEAPYRVVLCPPGTLPRTSSGKLRRAETWRQFAVGELQAAVEPGALQLARRILDSELRRRRLESERTSRADDPA